MAAQHSDLVGQHGRVAEDVAGVGILRDQPQRLLLAAAADHDPWPGLRDRFGHAQGFVQLVVLSGKGAVVAAPHLQADPQRFLQPLETLGQWRKGHAEARVLALVPCRAEAEFRTALREHVERGDDLGEQAGVPVGHARDQQPQAQCRGQAREEAERRVAFEHRVLWSARHLDLEIVIHQRERAHSDFFRRARNVRQPRRDAVGAGRPCELGNVKIEIHRLGPFRLSLCALPGRHQLLPGGARCQSQARLRGD